MQEKQIEQYLVKQVKSLGGISLKLTALIGIPDRLVLLPGSRCVFVELKAPGEKPRKIQIKKMAQLRALGFTTCVVDSYQEVDELLSEVMIRGI